MRWRFPGDVAAPGTVAHLVNVAESQLGPVDILVNNAGVVGPIGYDWDVDAIDWWRTFESNMRGSFLCARAVLSGMVKRGRGKIVNVSSGATFNRLPQMSAYCATKAALAQWTKCLAADTAPLAVQGLTDGAERGHLIGDVPALLAVAIVLAALAPRGRIAQG